MDTSIAASLFESLSSPIRLDIFRLLVKHGQTGLVAGEIASELNVPPSNLSFHLKTLSHTGLVLLTQEGRYQRCRANLELMQQLLSFLTRECCAGHPEACFKLTEDHLK